MTTEQRNKINWLNRAFHADKSARAWMEKCDRERSLAQRLTRTFSGTGSGNSGNSVEDALIRLMEAEERTLKKLKELIGIREEVTKVIQDVTDDDLQAVLVWHYLNYLTFEQTAEKMHYDKRTIQRKHKKALDEIVIECHSEMCYNDNME